MSIGFVGSYTEMLAPGFGGHGQGIYTIALDDLSGEIKLLHCTETVNSGYLVISDDKDYLYAVKEVESANNPLVKAYRINDDYSLTFLNERPIPGSLACHIELYDDAVFVSCYGTGNVVRFPLEATGQLSAYSHDYKHHGSSINKERQEAPHAHQTVIHPDRKHAYVSDLGIDKVKAYRIDQGEMLPDESFDIDIPKGSGPRHMVFNPEGDVGYLINELTAEVSILKQTKNTSFKFYKNIPSLPASFVDLPSASAIRMHPNSNYLYVANRTLDAITVYKIDKDNLEQIAFQFTQGTTLREFNISPNGKWLIACLQDSDETVVYKIESTGALIETFRTKVLASPVCLKFL